MKHANIMTSANSFIYVNYVRTLNFVKFVVYFKWLTMLSSLTTTTATTTNNDGKSNDDNDWCFGIDFVHWNAFSSWNFINWCQWPSKCSAKLNHAWYISTQMQHLYLNNYSKKKVEISTEIVQDLHVNAANFLPKISWNPTENVCKTLNIHSEII